MKNSDIIARVVIDYYTKFPELMRSDILHTQEVVSYTRVICVGEEMDEHVPFPKMVHFPKNGTEVRTTKKRNGGK